MSSEFGTPQYKALSFRSGSQDRPRILVDSQNEQVGGTDRDSESQRHENSVRSVQLSSSVSRSILFHPHEVLTLLPLDIESLNIPAFSDTPSNIRASSLELSGMRLDSPTPTPQGTPSVEGPSALSILISQNPPLSAEQNSEQQLVEDVQSADPFQTNTQTPTHTAEVSSTPTETTPLITRIPHTQHQHSYGSSKKNKSPVPRRFIHSPSWRSILHVLPAVVLGLLLNILDGLSYGLITFPATGVFEGFGGTGVSMFFITAVISQLVYSLGGSGFAGANGSMMIEVVPFFHILALDIQQQISDPESVIATTMAAFALSSILTGLTFFLLGFLNLGVLIGFFPRHILVGCIGGVGIFLVETGFEVSASITGGFEYNLEMLAALFEPHNVLRWLPALLLALGLRPVMTRWNHQLVFPAYVLTIPVVFYLSVAIIGVNLPTLRRTGWVFDMGNVSEPWYHFYSYFNFKKTSLRALWATMPTQLALLFFNILHPPLNVPALAVSLDQDIDTNRELVAHGYSNLLAGLTGSLPNYLVYVNTLLFYRLGGGTRLAGVLLAIFTGLLLLVGTGPIGYIPIMVVGTLIFILGFDLIKEALWDTRHRASRSEYITIVSIMICMTLWDFVIGVLFGIIVSCVFFVVQNSRAASIRAEYTAESAISAVRRPGAQRAYIREVAKQTVIMKLQGHLFFGTITQVEGRIRQLLDEHSWRQNPIRFLVVDLSLVAGIDLSSAEAFVRIERLLTVRRVILVLCGFGLDSDVGKALEGVELFRRENVELFSTLNDALEWTENAYLKAWLMSRKDEEDARAHAMSFPGRQHLPPPLAESMENSPRRSQLKDAGSRIFSSMSATTDSEQSVHGEPFETLLKAFSSHGPLDLAVLRPLISYFTRIVVSEGEIIWRQGEPSDALYLIQSGVLRASYTFGASPGFEESMVAGTLTGELSAISGTTRNATVVVERDAVLWRLGIDDLQRLETEHPSLARTFIKLILKAAKIDYDIFIAALAARQ